MHGSSRIYAVAASVSVAAGRGSGQAAAGKRRALRPGISGAAARRRKAVSRRKHRPDRARTAPDDGAAVRARARLRRREVVPCPGRPYSTRGRQAGRGRAEARAGGRAAAVHGRGHRQPDAQRRADADRAPRGRAALRPQAHDARDEYAPGPARLSGSPGRRAHGADPLRVSGIPRRARPRRHADDAPDRKGGLCVGRSGDPHDGAGGGIFTTQTGAAGAGAAGAAGAADPGPRAEPHRARLHHELAGHGLRLRRHRRGIRPWRASGRTSTASS